MLLSEGPRLLSRPMGVEWAGWRTDTLTLQRNGWEMAIEFDICYHAYRLLLRHKMMRLYALTDAMRIEEAMSHNGNLADVPVFHICGVAPTIRSLEVPGINFSAFREIDAAPRVVTNKITCVEDLNIFAAPMPGAKGEVLIDGADMSVIEHLEAIKRLQSASQQEIRDRIIDSRKEGSDVLRQQSGKSNVIALVNYKAA